MLDHMLVHWRSATPATLSCEMEYTYGEQDYSKKRFNEKWSNAIPMINCTIWRVCEMIQDVCFISFALLFFCMTCLPSPALNVLLRVECKWKLGRWDEAKKMKKLEGKSGKLKRFSYFFGTCTLPYMSHDNIIFLFRPVLHLPSCYSMFS